MTKRSGFTLLEVLVALALVASALGGTMFVVRNAINQQSHLRQRLLAQWVADNALAQFRLEQPRPEARRYSGHETLLGQQFNYVVAVTRRAVAAGAAPLLDIAVDVADSASTGTALAHASYALALAPVAAAGRLQ